VAVRSPCYPTGQIPFCGLNCRNADPRISPIPRKRRFFLPDVPVHVVQRGNNRQAIFFDDNDYRVYLDWLGEAAAAHGCAIHAYALMTNHIHLLMTAGDAQAISATLQAIGRRFVPYINHCYGRTGTLWEGRFRASPRGGLPAGVLSLHRAQSRACRDG
jgi:REP element-mobilizing transposase RayT